MCSNTGIKTSPDNLFEMSAINGFYPLRYNLINRMGFCRNSSFQLIRPIFLPINRGDIFSPFHPDRPSLSRYGNAFTRGERFRCKRSKIFWEKAQRRSKRSELAGVVRSESSSGKVSLGGGDLIQTRLLYKRKQKHTRPRAHWPIIDSWGAFESSFIFTLFHSLADQFP